MKRVMRWFAIVGLMMGLIPSSTLAEVVQYKGARVGFTSERDVVFDIPPSMTCEDLTRVMNSFYSRYLEPEQNRPFTLAERRLLLLCIYTNLCDMSALWTGLLNVYKCDDPTRYNDCPDINMMTGYLVDCDKLYLIRNRFEMKQYAPTQAYQRYVVGMNRAIYGWWTDSKTGRRVPTDVDKAIFRQILMAAAWNETPNLRYLEKNYNSDAIVWDRYWGVVKSDSFRSVWLDLRRYYQGQSRRVLAQKATLENQAQQLFDDIATEDVMRTFLRDWGTQIDQVKGRLHRCVYDAPYCLLVTKAMQDVAQFVSSTESTSLWDTAVRFLERDDYAIRRVKETVLAVSTQMGDVRDITTQLTSQISILQSNRFTMLLKMAMGSGAYNGFCAQTQLLMQMEKVGDGYAL